MNDETREFWCRVADDWLIQVGEDGDSNRILNSDPVLWRFAGDVRGLDVLDAGCGTGYLSRKLSDRGARVTGIDFAERMIEIARSRNPSLDFRVDSCSELRTLGNERFDLIVSNYVLMDAEDLDGVARAFFRVLRRGGIAALVFSHPCFPQDYALAKQDGTGTQYTWPFSYFEPQKRVSPAWAHFTSDFIWFHRPLSDYWRAFRTAGFEVVDLDEPRITEERHHLVGDPQRLQKLQTRPFSIAFKLRKP